ncbi:MAG: hypothetical protein EBQ96_09575 [Proteobacteria bacterium]|nr:hypothetical protein [Pseudomonadota bacterium]
MNHAKKNPARVRDATGLIPSPLQKNEERKMKLPKNSPSINLVVKDGKNTARKAVTGRQVVRTIKALVKAGAKGITALEVSTWAFRLGAYIHILRHTHGLNIQTLREPHDGGTHARYVLLTPVTLTEVAP